MSHNATNWAIKQRGLKPAAKIVLWHLCDRYHPDHGCFPSLDTLAHDCEMSRRSVQDQIDALEAAGLLRVEKQPREKGRLPRNRYILRFEWAPEQAENAPDLGQDLPKAALGKICQGQNLPRAKSDAHLGQNLPTNSVRGTSKKTSRGKEPDGFSAFWDAYPRKVAKGAAEKAYRKALTQTDPETLRGAAARYALDPRRSAEFTAHPATWLNARRWEDEPPAAAEPSQPGRRRVVPMLTPEQRAARDRLERGAA